MLPKGPGDRPRRAAWGVVGAFAILTTYFTGVFPVRPNPNDLSRFETVVAMGEWKTFSIDRAITLLGDHEDKSASGGLFYSNKAPGLAFAAYPIYLALRLVLPVPASGTSGLVFYGIRLLTVSLTSIIALYFLARRIAAEARDKSVAPLVVLAAGFGTPMLFYARSFFSHAWTASLLFFAWELLRRGEEPGTRRPPWTGVLAGFLAGLAAISEYTVAPIALLLAVRACVGAPRRRALEFVLGATPVLMLLLAYNAACFGSPFILSYAREATPQFAKIASSGFAGLHHPSPSIAFGYLFHPARGVLIFSPFLAWSALGIVRWWRSRESRPDCVLVLAATSLFFVLLSTYPNWHGGGSLGSRYLLPGLFFVAVPIGHSLNSALSRGLFLAATTFSVAQHFLLTASYPHFTLDIPWPAITASLWLLERGFVAPNIGSLLGAGPLASLVLPMAATSTAMLLAARFGRPMRPGVSAALTVGLAPLAALILWTPTLPFDGKLVRASIICAFSSLDPEGREILAVKREATTAEERRRAEEMWRHRGPPPTKVP
jgi:hypothetical protein